jgi:hypothetical protein
MNAVPARAARSIRLPGGTTPALLALACGLAVILLRPPVPID